MIQSIIVNMYAKEYMFNIAYTQLKYLSNFLQLLFW